VRSGGGVSALVLVGIPLLDGGINVEHPVVVAPVDDLFGLDVPAEVDKQVARAEVRAEHGGLQAARTAAVRTVCSRRSSGDFFAYFHFAVALDCLAVTSRRVRPTPYTRDRVEVGDLMVVDRAATTRQVNPRR
jgi:hypothetical protein